ncbi:response regulator [Propionivibrio dicarboxylicus]|uniref:Response regulator receiver domain-containing protein n=1 Tax=Propionivibrio dicarboxylicus TaxID=83767 RepID=A0A1G8I246_9RHOO|nr:response regulator [Propionivibrio dicarboxylicus]SDI12882.1 Response regulator receiver domain-containing protein [Propionivibrio dicarboxylicus]
MTPYAIPPFYFPTTVAFIDDSPSFLESIALGLDSRLAYRKFDSPFSALVALNGATPALAIGEDLLSIYQHRGECSQAHHVIDINLDKIHRVVHNEQRFEQISVVVIDYDMPEINGLELCRGIRNPAVKKILLTGKADEQVGIQAFNEGIIDRFIKKQYPDAIARLNTAIADLQMEYLRQLQDALMHMLAVGSHVFLFDRMFAARFQEICKELNIVEHYLSCTPDGLLLLDTTGSAHLLIVQTEAMMRSHFEIADELGAPKELLQQLSSRHHIPYFWKTSGDYSPAYDDWKSCLYPAHEFTGQNGDNYLYTVINSPSAFNLKYIHSYGDYLDQLDAEARQGILGR